MMRPNLKPGNAADVPVVQLSVQPDHDTAHHLRLGHALRPLADEGILIIGSGHATHNLRDWASSPRRQEPLPYADAFSRWLQQSLASADGDALTHYRDRAPDAARAHPTEEHFLPLFIAWGAAGEGATAERVQAGIEQVYREGKALTRDVGGTSGTKAFADAVLHAMETPVTQT